jgi:7-cyano-7-deazaguanine synthase
MERAVVLLSGGLDSCVLLAHAVSLQKSCFALSFSYGQRHSIELESAKKIAAFYGVPHHILQIDKALFSDASSSSLLNATIHVDTSPTCQPSTYVPCRNLLFLSFAASFAEARNISEIYVGANAHDGPSYPDCRASFFAAFEETVRKGSNDTRMKILHPFIDFSKKQIVALGNELKAPIEMSWSCYDPQEKKPCGVCRACVLRDESLSLQSF